jgi:hypothetical protein
MQLLKNLYPVGWIILVYAMLGSCDDYSEQVTGDYYFFSGDNKSQVVAPKGWKAGDNYIPCNVIAYRQIFIVALQDVVESCFWQAADSKKSKKMEHGIIG